MRLLGSKSEEMHTVAFWRRANSDSSNAKEQASSSVIACITRMWPYKAVGRGTKEQASSSVFL